MSTHSDREFEEQLAKQRINIRTWPHQFTKSGRKEQIGENTSFQPTEGQSLKIYSEEYYCVHCQASYWSRKEGPPVGMCPARNKNREMKRLLG